MAVNVRDMHTINPAVPSGKSYSVEGLWIPMTKPTLKESVKAQYKRFLSRYNYGKRRGLNTSIDDETKKKFQYVIKNL